MKGTGVQARQVYEKMDMDVNRLIVQFNWKLGRMWCLFAGRFSKGGTAEQVPDTSHFLNFRICSLEKRFLVSSLMDEGA